MVAVHFELLDVRFACQRTVVHDGDRKGKPNNTVHRPRPSRSRETVFQAHNVAKLSWVDLMMFQSLQRTMRDTALQWEERSSAGEQVARKVSSKGGAREELKSIGGNQIYLVQDGQERRNESSTNIRWKNRGLTPCAELLKQGQRPREASKKNTRNNNRLTEATSSAEVHGDRQEASYDSRDLSISFTGSSVAQAPRALPALSDRTPARNVVASRQSESCNYAFLKNMET